MNRSIHAVRMLGSLRILLRHAQPTEKALAALHHAFDSWPDNDRMLPELLQERARFIETAENGMQPYAPALARILFHPFISRSGRNGIASFEPAIAVARLPLADRAAAIQSSAELRAYRPPPLWRFRMVGALFDPFPMAYAPTGLSQAKQELAARRVAVAAIAVERYRRAQAGAAPASLDALVPAFLAAVRGSPVAEAARVSSRCRCLRPLQRRRESQGRRGRALWPWRGDREARGAAVAARSGHRMPLKRRAALNLHCLRYVFFFSNRLGCAGSKTN